MKKNPKIVLLGVLVLIGILTAHCSSSPKMSYSGLGVESVSSEVISNFVAPQLTPEVSAKIQHFLDVRAPGSGVYDPIFKRLFFSWKVTGVKQVWRLDSAKSFPIQMTGGEDQTSIAEVAPNGKYIVLSRDEGGKENPGIYLQSALGGPLEKIQHLAKVQSHFQFISKDSNTIYYRSNDLEADSFAIYKYDIDKKSKELVFSEKGIWSIADHRVDKQGVPTHLLIERAKTNLYSEFFELDLKSHIKIPVIGQLDNEEYSVSFARNKGEYFILTSKFSEFRRLYFMKDGEFKAITPELKWDVQSFKTDNSITKLYYSVNEGGYTRAFVVDPKTFQKISMPDFGRVDHVSVGSLSIDGRYAVLTIEKSTAPNTSYVFDWKTRKLTQWVLPSAPEIVLSRFVEAELVDLNISDQTKIPAFIRYPAGCKDVQKLCPIVVHFHGGPESQSTAGFDLFAQMMVDAGFILVEPNVRGSDGYGKTWLNSDNGPKRLEVIGDIKDVATSLKKLRTHQNIVPKIGVMGWSYGGYSTFMAMSKFAGAYQAGVALVGMSDLYTFLMNTAPYRRILRISEYGDPEKDREALRQLSAVTYLDQVKDPLLIIQGVNDPRVPVQEAIQMHQKLKEKNIPSQLILFADEGHGSSKRSNQVLEIGNVIEFFNKYLKGI